jgi:hypothetical protein
MEGVRDAVRSRQHLVAEVVVDSLDGTIAYASDPRGESPRWSRRRSYSRRVVGSTGRLRSELVALLKGAKGLGSVVTRLHYVELEIKVDRK